VKTISEAPHGIVATKEIMPLEQLLIKMQDQFYEKNTTTFYFQLCFVLEKAFLAGGAI
jgi:hypothetical protein